MIENTGSTRPTRDAGITTGVVTMTMTTTGTGTGIGTDSRRGRAGGTAARDSLQPAARLADIQ